MWDGLNVFRLQARLGLGKVKVADEWWGVG
jgi:hypothetical protein